MSAAAEATRAPAEWTGLERLIRWGRRILDYPGPGWLTFALAVVVAVVVVWSFHYAQWVPVLPGVVIAVAVGAGFGLLNARWRAAPAAQLVVALFLGVAQSFAHTVMLVAGSSLEGRALTAGYRIGLWTEALLDGGASTDRLTFVFLLLAAAWIITYITVYLTLTTQSVWAILPAGFAIVTNMTYLPPHALPWFLLFLLASALLIVRLVFLERRREWRETDAVQGSWLPLHAMHAGIWFAALVFIVTILSPAIGTGPRFVQAAWSDLRGPVGDAEGALTRIFASLPARRSFALYGFGNELPFRGNISLPEDVLMHVEADERLYWKARTYDDYHGWGWSNSPMVADERRGLEDIAGASYQDCADCVRNITFEMKAPASTVFTAATPLRTTLPVEARFINVDVDEGHRLVKLDSLRVLQPNQRYTVQVYVPTVTGQDLEAVPPEYDDWVRDTYTALPEDLPPSITRLAAAITAGEETQYAKAVALRDYLRTFEYSQDIPAPPPGKDGLSHFLFTLKSGYSEYFGSAHTVLMRSAGIPARLVVGYLPGGYDAEAGVFVVRESDAHAWSEAYFPGYGWIPFEATPNEDARAPGGPIDAVAAPANAISLTDASGDLAGFAFEDEDLLQTSNDNLELEDEAILQAGDDSFLSISARDAAVYLGAALGAALALASLFVWWRALIRPRSAARAYAQTVRLGRLAGFATRPDETPEEYIGRLAQAMPRATFALYGVVQWYDHVLYGPDKQAPPYREFSWRTIVVSLLTLAALRFIPTARARMKREPTDAR